MTTDVLQLADAYFAPGNHIKASVWGAATQDVRLGALATAERRLKRGFRISTWPMDEQADGIRPDYALFEQAVFEIESLGTTGGENFVAANPVGLPAADVQKDVDCGEWAPEALRWLNWTGTVTVRG